MQREGTARSGTVSRRAPPPELKDDNVSLSSFDLPSLGGLGDVPSDSSSPLVSSLDPSLVRTFSERSENLSDIEARIDALDREFQWPAGLDVPEANSGRTTPGKRSSTTTLRGKVRSGSDRFVSLERKLTDRSDALRRRNSKKQTKKSKRKKKKKKHKQARDTPREWGHSAESEQSFRARRSLQSMASTPWAYVPGNGVVPNEFASTYVYNGMVPPPIAVDTLAPGAEGYSDVSTCGDLDCEECGDVSVCSDSACSQCQEMCGSDNSEGENDGDRTTTVPAWAERAVLELRDEMEQSDMSKRPVYRCLSAHHFKALPTKVRKLFRLSVQTLAKSLYSAARNVVSQMDSKRLAMRTSLSRKQMVVVRRVLEELLQSVTPYLLQTEKARACAQLLKKECMALTRVPESKPNVARRRTPRRSPNMVRARRTRAIKVGGPTKKARGRPRRRRRNARHQVVGSSQPAERMVIIESVYSGP